MVSGAELGLESITDCAADMAETEVLGKDRLLCIKTACGVTPVPVRAIAGVETDALSVMRRFAENIASLNGSNTTEMTHEALAASVVPHVLVSAKLVGFAPVRVILEIVKVAVPEFESVMVCAADVVPVI